MATASGTGAEPPVLLLQPGEPLPVQFMNTVWADRSGVHDELGSPGQLAAWLEAAADNLTVLRLPLRDLDDQDLLRYRRLRDALRRMAASVTADDRPAAQSATKDVDQAVRDVNAAAALAPSWPELTLVSGDPGKIVGSSGEQVSAALSWLAGAGVELIAGEARESLRACYAPSCVLYFVKSHPRREWCSAGCGNRARVARHYERHHARSD